MRRSGCVIKYRLVIAQSSVFVRSGQHILSFVLNTKQVLQESDHSLSRYRRRVTVQNLEVVAVDKENSFILVRGAVPGPKNGVVRVLKAVKATAQGK